MDYFCCLSLGGNPHFLDFLQKKFYNINYSGQSYKASTLVNYDSRVVTLSKLLVITTLES